MDETLNRCARGAMAGLAATAPMTAVMAGLHAALPPQERDPLPPEQITENAVRADGPAVDALAWVAHFGYGATAGACYALAKAHLPGPPSARGACFGLALWAAGYLGWLPAMGLYRSATEEPARRNALIILSHLVYGMSLGLCEDALTSGPG